MGRTKQSIGFYPFAPGFDGLYPEDVAKVEEILGSSQNDDFLVDLVLEIDGWLVRFGALRELRYGADERRVAEKARKSATELAECFKRLGEIGIVALDRYAYRHRVENDAFLAVLADLEEMVEYLDLLAGDEINAAALQVQAIAGVFRRHGLEATASHDTRSVPFSPSRFVRMLDCLWTIEPRLRLYHARSADYWPNVSQWVSARLSEDVNFDQLNLVHRSRLK